MPLNYNDGIDDPLLFDAQASFLGGMVSNTRVNLLPPEQAALLQDVDVEQNGRLRTRRGFRAVGDLRASHGGAAAQGLHWYDSVSSQYLLAVAGGNLYCLDGSGVWTTVRNAAVGDATLPAYIAQVNDRVFAVSAGANKTTHWNAADLTGATTGTSITDGPANLSLLTAQRFRLFGVAPDAIDELWVSKFLPEGATPFSQEAEGVLVPMNPTRIGEGEGDSITGLFAWKAFILLVFKQASIWAVDTSPALQAADASPSNVAGTFGVERLSGRVGCVAHRTIVMAGNDVLFLGRDGVRGLQRTLADPAGAVSEALSYPVDDYIQRINWAVASSACATYWNGRYLLAVPLDGSMVNNAVLVYQPSQNRWQVWTGLQPIQFAVTRFSGQPQKLAVLDARGDVLVFQDYIPQGQASAVHYRDRILGSDIRPAWRVRTRALTWQELANPKQPDFVEFEFDRSTALVDVSLGLDSPPDTLLQTKVNTGSAAVLVLPFTLPARLGQLSVKRKRISLLGQPPAREVMFELSEAANLNETESSGSGYLSLRSVLAGAFPEALENQE
ncbi:MAG TPA: hypothetical protein VMF06_06905 [Candidatus Limnocylindria bacterium]|nr:hypothetical protein [Candidatus Limnocylindria bacterium]